MGNEEVLNQRLIGMIKEQCRYAITDEEVYEATSLEELNFDSIDIITLSGEIETLTNRFLAPELIAKLSIMSFHEIFTAINTLCGEEKKDADL